jgi:hypothetical protein
VTIKGPGGPTTPPTDPSAIGEVAATGAPKPASGEGTFASKVSAPLATNKTLGPKSAEDPIAAVAAELKQGTLSPRQAVDRLLDLATSQGAGAHLPSAVRAKIRADLEDLVKHDPFLASKAKRLGLDDET